MKWSTVISAIISLLVAAGTVLLIRQSRLLTPIEGGAQSAPKIATIVVAAESLRYGQKLEASKLRVIEWHAPTLPQGALDTIEKLAITPDGPYVLDPVSVGSPILKHRITVPGQRPSLSSRLSPGHVASTISVNTITGVAGFVLPDERVDIILSRRLSDRKVADVLLSDVRVLAVDSVIDPGTGKAVPAKSVTFEVQREDAQRMILATGLGEISLALRSTNPGMIKESRRISDDDVGRRENTLPTPKATPVASKKPAVMSGNAEIRVYRGMTLERYNVPR